jgi:hypothetical protein
LIPLPDSNDGRGHPAAAMGCYPNGFHFIAISYEAEAEEKTSETVIQKIFDELPVP